MNIPRHNQYPVDTSIVSQMLKFKPSLSFSTDTKIRKIRSVILFETGYDPMQTIKSRSGRLVISRQLFLYFVKYYTRLSQERVGALLGKDHATVHHAIDCVNKYKDTEKDYAVMFKNIDEKLSNHFNT
jgi:chromosomal replication initiation ATPase DnaA